MPATENALEFAAALTEKFLSDKRYLKGSRYITVVPGKRFDKLVAGEKPGELGCIFAFIERTTGNLHRALSWARPEPHPRYSADELMSEVLKHADPYGNFLSH